MVSPHRNSVLVIDFDPGVREQCRTMLEGEGFRVFLGSTRADAESLVEAHDPTLVIIGTFLPDGPGYRLFEDERFANIPVVGLTDVFQGPTVRRLMKEEYPFLELLDKPLSGANLIDLMRVHFGGAYPEASTSRAVDDANRAPTDDDQDTWVREREDDVSEELPILGHVAAESEFIRVPTSPTHRPASGTSSLPPSLDWRAVPDEGTLGSISFAAIMSRMLHTQHTGALRLSRQRVRKIVFLEQGSPVSVRSNLLYECLGNLLVREGLVDEVLCDESIERAQAEGKRQGEVLIEMGALTQHQLDDLLERQLEERLLDVSGWTDARFHLQAMNAPPKVAPIKREDTYRLTTQGVLERAPLEVIIRELESCLPIELQLVATEEQISWLGLREHHLRVVSELKRGGSLLELVARFEQSSQVYQVIYALLVLGFAILDG